MDSIPEEKLIEIRSKGFSRNPTVADIMIDLNDKYQNEGKSKTGGISWWVTEKNKKENEGKEFVDLVIEIAKKELWQQTQ